MQASGLAKPAWDGGAGEAWSPHETFQEARLLTATRTDAALPRALGLQPRTWLPQKAAGLPCVAGLSAAAFLLLSSAIYIPLWGEGLLTLSLKLPETTWH